MYKSLYRKYRPKNFDDIVGQEKVIEVLKNQIISGKVGHAYLFTGVRGTGKTSTAKIFSNAINCEHLENGNPCNKCDACLSIKSGDNVDIIEMDAASNNGVEDIRIIRDEINFLPTSLNNKIYIIDEAHMLTPAASNALLKTLEEPPAHVKFILATTDPQKLPATILSRCQRFEFLTIPEEKIAGQLEYIAKDVNIDITPEALNLVANLANGSMRDGISILESISNSNEKVTQDIVREIVGIPDTKKIIQAVFALVYGDIDTLLDITNEILDEGKDPQSYIQEILKSVEAGFLKQPKLLNVYSEDEKNKLLKLQNVDKLEMYKLIRNLIDCITSLKYAESKRIMLTSGLISIAQRNLENPKIQASKNNSPYTNATIASVQNQNTQVEQKVELGKEESKVQQEQINTNNTNNVNMDEKASNEENPAVQSSHVQNILGNILHAKIDEKPVVEEIVIEKEEPKENIVEQIKVEIPKEQEQKVEQKQEQPKKIKIEKVEEKTKVENKENKEVQVQKLHRIDIAMLRQALIRQRFIDLFIALSGAYIEQKDGKVYINLKNEKDVSKLEQLNTTDALNKIKEVVCQLIGADVPVEYIL